MKNAASPLVRSAIHKVLPPQVGGTERDFFVTLKGQRYIWKLKGVLSSRPLCGIGAAPDFAYLALPGHICQGHAYLIRQVVAPSRVTRLENTGGDVFHFYG